jgi:hypothetical protein
VKSSESKELRIITTYGESPIITRYQVELDSENEDRVWFANPQKFQYASEKNKGYRYVHVNFIIKFL